MGLSDFEKELSANKDKHHLSHKRRERSHSRSRDKNRSSRHNKSQRSTHQSDQRDDERRDRKRRKRRDDEEKRDKHVRENEIGRNAEVDDNEDEDEDEWVEKVAKNDALDDMLDQAASKSLKRDTWMQNPSSIDIHYIQSKKKNDKSHFKRSTEIPTQATPVSTDLYNDKNVVDEDDNCDVSGDDNKIIQFKDKHQEPSYKFGDAGSEWRMSKLRNVSRQSKESGKSIEDIALEKYGDLKYFDEAREEEMELDRRKRYGQGYNWKEYPTGELYSKRTDQSQLKEKTYSTYTSAIIPQDDGPILDQNELNKLKARAMRAKITKDPDSEKLEDEYNKAVAKATKNGPRVIQLNAMENRMLTGGRQGEVVAITNKRGTERGNVIENENMTIDDMVRQERRTKGRSEGLILADKISRDTKFTDGLDYLNDNAEKLAKRIQKSEINLRNMAIEDYQKVKKALEKCQLCHNEEKGKSPAAPIISLGTRVYLTLATEPEICPGSAYIVPIEHHTNLLECDDDEWEEIRNFMKCLIRMFHDRRKSVIFYENAAAPNRRLHAAMAVIPIPHNLGETAPAFFREAILASDEEWSQHRKIIDTLSKAKNGMGRIAFRNSLAKEMPYFHVWFEVDGGLGHVVEDERRWPKGDLFAREVLGGMLDVDPTTIKHQGRWSRNDKRVDSFHKNWKKFDWTRVLTEE